MAQMGHGLRGCEEIEPGWISAVRSSRQPLRSFLRMRKLLNAINHVLHAEGALGRVSKHAPKPMQRLQMLRDRFLHTLFRRKDEEGDAAVNHLNAPEH